MWNQICHENQGWQYRLILNLINLKFQTLYGAERRVKNLKKYLINWDGKSKSKFQKEIKKFLKRYWRHHVVFEEFPVVGTRLTLDFYNANKKIAVEAQGEQHIRFVEFFHGNYRNNYLDQLKRDQQKMQFCEINNIKLAEIYYNDKVEKKLFKKFDIDL